MSTAGLDTVVAGVRCREVLTELSDYLDGALPAERVATLQMHLTGCDNCTRFGGLIAVTLESLRAAAVPERTDLTERVLARLANDR